MEFDPGEIQRLGDRKEELYREIVRQTGITVLPGARELLAALKAAGIARAIGSSTPRKNLDAIFESTGLGEFLRQSFLRTMWSMESLLRRSF